MYVYIYVYISIYLMLLFHRGQGYESMLSFVICCPAFGAVLTNDIYLSLLLSLK